jgi:NADPH:quinone reductase
VDNLQLATLPLPRALDGWVRIRVETFGLNRPDSEMTS